MADQKFNVELEDLAADFAKAAAAANPRMDPTQRSINAFRDAEAHLAVRQKLRDGKLSVEKPTGPQLADACAPNLPRLHPHNMVSQRFGNLERVGKINAWLALHPTPETEPEQLIPELNRAFPEVSWDLATIGTARAIFPAYAAKN